MLLLLCFSSLQLEAFWPDCPSVPLPNTTAGPRLSGWLKSPALRAPWLSSYCGTSAPKWAEFPGRLTEDKLAGEKDAPMLTQIICFLFNWPRSEFNYCCNLHKNVSTSHLLSCARRHKVPADCFIPWDVIIQPVPTCSDCTVGPFYSTVGDAGSFHSLSHSTESAVKCLAGFRCCHV